MAFFCINSRSSSHNVKKSVSAHSKIFLPFFWCNFFCHKIVLLCTCSSRLYPKSSFDWSFFFDDFALKIGIESVKVLSNLRLLLQYMSSFKFRSMTFKSKLVIRLESNVINVKITFCFFFCVFLFLAIHLGFAEMN